MCVQCADVHFGVFRVTDPQAACVWPMEYMVRHSNDSLEPAGQKHSVTRWQRGCFFSPQFIPKMRAKLMSNMKIIVPDGILTFEARFKGYIEGKVQPKNENSVVNCSPSSQGKYYDHETFLELQRKIVLQHLCKQQK